MKGLSETMYIIIAVIVILIVALVVLTIFRIVPTGISSIAEARSNCQITAQSTCVATGTLPSSWNFADKQTDQGLLSCRDLLPSCSCDNRVLSC